MKALKPWIVLALVFVAGVIVGVGATRLAVHRVLDRVMSNPAVVGEKIEHDLARDLRLTPEQRSKVHVIVVQSEGDLKDIRLQVRPRVAQVLKRSEREIRAVLTEAQQAKFDRLLLKKPFLRPAAGAVTEQK